MQAQFTTTGPVRNQPIEIDADKLAEELAKGLSAPVGGAVEVGTKADDKKSPVLDKFKELIDRTNSLSNKQAAAVEAIPDRLHGLFAPDLDEISENSKEALDYAKEMHKLMEEQDKRAAESEKGTKAVTGKQAVEKIEKEKPVLMDTANRLTKEASPKFQIEAGGLDAKAQSALMSTSENMQWQAETGQSLHDIFAKRGSGYTHDVYVEAAMKRQNAILSNIYNLLGSIHNHMARTAGSPDMPEIDVAAVARATPADPAYSDVVSAALSRTGTLGSPGGPGGPTATGGSGGSTPPLMQGIDNNAAQLARENYEAIAKYLAGMVENHEQLAASTMKVLAGNTNIEDINASILAGDEAAAKKMAEISQHIYRVMQSAQNFASTQTNANQSTHSLANNLQRMAMFIPGMLSDSKQNTEEYYAQEAAMEVQMQHMQELSSMMHKMSPGEKVKVMQQQAKMQQVLADGARKVAEATDYTEKAKAIKNMQDELKKVIKEMDKIAAKKLFRDDMLDGLKKVGGVLGTFGVGMTGGGFSQFTGTAFQNMFEGPKADLMDLTDLAWQYGQASVGASTYVEGMRKETDALLSNYQDLYKSGERLNQLWGTSAGVVAETGQDINVINKLTGQMIRRGNRGINQTRTILKSALNLSTQMGMNAESTAAMFQDWSMHIGSSDNEMTRLARHVKIVGQTSGVMGDNLLEAVKSAKEMALHMRNAGLYTEEAGRAMVSFAAEAQKVGVGQQMQQFLQSSGAGLRGFVDGDKGMKNLIAMSGRGNLGRVMDGTAMSTRENRTNLAAGMGEAIERFLPRDALARGIVKKDQQGRTTIDTTKMSQEERSRADLILQRMFGKGLGELTQMLGALNEGSRNAAERQQALGQELLRRGLTPSDVEALKNPSLDDATKQAIMRSGGMTAREFADVQTRMLELGRAEQREAIQGQMDLLSRIADSSRQGVTNMAELQRQYAAGVDSAKRQELISQGLLDASKSSDPAAVMQAGIEQQIAAINKQLESAGQGPVTVGGTSNVRDLAARASTDRQAMAELNEALQSAQNRSEVQGRAKKDPFTEATQKAMQQNASLQDVVRGTMMVVHKWLPWLKWLVIIGGGMLRLLMMSRLFNRWTRGMYMKMTKRGSIFTKDIYLRREMTIMNQQLKRIIGLLGKGALRDSQKRVPGAGMPVGNPTQIPHSMTGTKNKSDRLAKTPDKAVKQTAPKKKTKDLKELGYRKEDLIEHSRSKMSPEELRRRDLKREAKAKIAAIPAPAPTERQQKIASLKERGPKSFFLDTLPEKAKKVGTSVAQGFDRMTFGVFPALYKRGQKLTQRLHKRFVEKPEQGRFRRLKDMASRGWKRVSETVGGPLKTMKERVGSAFGAVSREARVAGKRIGDATAKGYRRAKAAAEGVLSRMRGGVKSAMEMGAKLPIIGGLFKMKPRVEKEMQNIGKAAIKGARKGAQDAKRGRGAATAPGQRGGGIGGRRSAGGALLVRVVNMPRGGFGRRERAQRGGRGGAGGGGVGRGGGGGGGGKGGGGKGGGMLGALGGMAGALMGAVAAIGAVAGIFMLLSQHSEKLQGVIQKIMDKVTPILAKIGDKLADLIIQLMPIFEEYLSKIIPVVMMVVDVLKELVVALIPVISVIYKLIGTVLTTLMKALGPVLKVIGELVKILAEALGPILEAVAEVIMAILEPVLDALSGLLVEVGNILKMLLVPILKVLTPVIKLLAMVLKVVLLPLKLLTPLIKLLAFVLDLLMIPLKPILWMLEKLGDVLSWLAGNSPISDTYDLLEIFGDVMKSLMKPINVMIGVLKAIFMPVLKLVGWYFETVGKILQGVVDIVSAIFMPVINAVGSAIQTVSDIISPFVEILKGVGDAFGSVSGILGGVTGAVSTVVGGVTGAVGSVVSGAGSLLSSLWPFAEGGVVGGASSGEGKPVPILAHVGEWILNSEQQQALIDGINSLLSVNLTPLVDTINGMVNALSTTISSMFNPLGMMSNVFGMFGNIMGGFVSKGGGIVESLGGMFAGWFAEGGVVGGGGASTPGKGDSMLAGVGAGELILNKEQQAKVVSTIASTGETAKSMATSVAGTVSNLTGGMVNLQPAVDGASGLFGDLFSVMTGQASIADVASDNIQSMTDTIKNMTGGMVDLGPAVDGVSNIFSNFGSVLSGEMSPIEAMTDNFSQLGGIFDTLTGPIQGVMGSLGGFGESISGMAGGVASSISSMFGGFFSEGGMVGGGGGKKGTGDNVLAAVGVGEAILNADQQAKLASVLDAVSETALGPALQTASDMFSNFAAVLDGSKSPIEGVMDHVGLLGDMFGNLIGPAMSVLNVLNPFSGVFSLLGSTFGGLLGPVGSFIDSINPLSSLTGGDFFSGLFGGKPKPPPPPAKDPSGSSAKSVRKGEIMRDKESTVHAEVTADATRVLTDEATKKGTIYVEDSALIAMLKSDLFPLIQQGGGGGGQQVTVQLMGLDQAVESMNSLALAANETLAPALTTATEQLGVILPQLELLGQHTAYIGNLSLPDLVDEMYLAAQVTDMALLPAMMDLIDYLYAVGDASRQVNEFNWGSLFGLMTSPFDNLFGFLNAGTGGLVGTLTNMATSMIKPEGAEQGGAGAGGGIGETLQNVLGALTGIKAPAVSPGRGLLGGMGQTMQKQLGEPMAQVGSGVQEMGDPGKGIGAQVNRGQKRLADKMGGGDLGTTFQTEISRVVQSIFNFHNDVLRLFDKDKQVAPPAPPTPPAPVAPPAPAPEALKLNENQLTKLEGILDQLRELLAHATKKGSIYTHDIYLEAMMKDIAPELTEQNAYNQMSQKIQQQQARSPERAPRAPKSEDDRKAMMEGVDRQSDLMKRANDTELRMTQKQIDSRHRAQTRGIEMETRLVDGQVDSVARARHRAINAEEKAIDKGLARQQALYEEKTDPKTGVKQASRAQRVMEKQANVTEKAAEAQFKVGSKQIDQQYNVALKQAQQQRAAMMRRAGNNKELKEEIQARYDLFVETAQAQRDAMKDQLQDRLGMVKDAVKEERETMADRIKETHESIKEAREEVRERAVLARETIDADREAAHERVAQAKEVAQETADKQQAALKAAATGIHQAREDAIEERRVERKDAIREAPLAKNVVKADAGDMGGDMMAMAQDTQILREEATRKGSLYVADHALLDWLKNSYMPIVQGIGNVLGNIAEMVYHVPGIEERVAVVADESNTMPDSMVPTKAAQVAQQPATQEATPTVGGTQERERIERHVQEARPSAASTQATQELAQIATNTGLTYKELQKVTKLLEEIKGMGKSADTGGGRGDATSSTNTQPPMRPNYYKWAFAQVNDNPVKAYANTGKS